jgi:hypothetical protein
MYDEEKISVEFEATIEEVEEQTGLEKRYIPLLFYFEKVYRDEKLFKSLKEVSLLHLLLPSLFVHSDVLGYSEVVGPGAPSAKILHPLSTFSDEEKLEKIFYFCKYYLLSPTIALKGRKIEDGILVCVSPVQNFVKLSLVNPKERVGKEIEIEEYDKGISNSNFCTFRKFYAPSEIFLINEKDFFLLTRKKLKEKLTDYETKSQLLYKLVNPFYETYNQFVKQKIKLLEEEFRKRLEYRI